MKNTHEFYVANPQNPSVDVWFTRDQRANFHICTSWCKEWCATYIAVFTQQRCPTLPVLEKLAYQWLLNKQPPARTSCHKVPTHFHIPPLLPKFHSKIRFESFQIKHKEHLKGLIQLHHQVLQTLEVVVSRCTICNLTTAGPSDDCLI